MVLADSSIFHYGRIVFQRVGSQCGIVCDQRNQRVILHGRDFVEHCVLRSIYIQAEVLQRAGIVSGIVSVRACIGQLRTHLGQRFSQFLSQFRLFQLAALHLCLFYLITLGVIFKHFGKAVVELRSVCLSARQIQLHVLVVIDRLLEVACKFPCFRIVGSRRVSQSRFDDLSGLGRIPLCFLRFFHHTFLC